MKGGLLLNNELEYIKTIEEAVSIFQNKDYSTFNILTNSSVSCITFKATLKPGIISPFIEIRSDIFGNPVRSLLFKFFPMNDSKIVKKMYDTKFKRGKEKLIEIANKYKIIKEYLLQLKIYQQTYNTISSAYEPVCPYPIHYQTNLNKNNTIDNIINLLEDRTDKTEIIDIIQDTLAYELKTDSAEELKKKKIISTIGYVVMEFIEDFVPFSYLYKKVSFDEEKKVIALIAYELSRLHSIGVIHGDLHIGNIMYNPNYKYITDDDTSREFLGRVLIIDFGRSKDKMESDIKQLNQEIYQVHGKNAVGEFNDYLDSKDKEIFYLFEFTKPYTFEYIYSKRLELTLKFRQTIINKTITDINNFIKDNPSKIAINELQKFKNSNNFKLALAVLKIKPLYPINFVTDNNNFNLNQFNYPFNKRKEKIFNALNITKRLKIDKIKEKIPIQFYPDKDLGNGSNISPLPLIDIDSLSEVSKVKKTKHLEKLSQIGFNTLKNLHIMFTKIFIKSKKQNANEGRGRNKFYYYLQYHTLTKKLNNNIIRQLNIHSKKLKRFKS
jgi:serine/threonine protein kinase